MARVHIWHLLTWIDMEGSILMIFCMTDLYAGLIVAATTGMTSHPVQTVSYWCIY